MGANMAVKPKAIGKLRVLYDPENDILYISLGEPRSALSLPDDEGLLLVRVDPQTREVIGLTILDYEQQFRRFPANLTWLKDKSVPTEILSFIQNRPPVSSSV